MYYTHKSPSKFLIPKSLKNFKVRKRRKKQHQKIFYLLLSTHLKLTRGRKMEIGVNFLIRSSSRQLTSTRLLQRLNKQGGLLQLRDYFSRDLSFFEIREMAAIRTGIGWVLVFQDWQTLKRRPVGYISLRAFFKVMGFVVTIPKCNAMKSSYYPSIIFTVAIDSNH